MHLSKSPVASASLQRRTRDDENFESPYVQKIVSLMVYAIKNVWLGAGLFQRFIVIPVTVRKDTARMSTSPEAPAHQRSQGRPKRAGGIAAARQQQGIRTLRGRQGIRSWQPDAIACRHLASEPAKAIPRSAAICLARTLGSKIVSWAPSSSREQQMRISGKAGP